VWKRWYIDMRPGLVVGITIPLVLAVTFLAMNYWGIGLHKISLGSLIIALGLLVDDAIIAVEMMVRKMEEGYDKVRAATFAYEVTAMPMLTGTLITATGFLPIGMARSTVGEYTFAIFAVTVVALVLSWLVSVYFVPYLGTLLLKAKPRRRPGAPRALRHAVLPQLPPAWWTGAWSTAGRPSAPRCCCLPGHRRHGQGAAAVLPGFEPARDPGRHLVCRRHVLRRQRGNHQALRAAPDARAGRGRRHHLGRLGRAALLPAAGPDLSAEQRLAADHPAEGPGTRESLRVKLPALLATEFPEVRGRVKLLPNGPPVPYPVQFRVLGPDPIALRERADEVKAAMRASPNTRGVNDNWNEAVKVLRLEVDQDKARALGVTSQSIAQASKTILSGTNIGQYREGDKLIDIVLRQPLDERNAITDIGNAYLPTASGKSIPLTQIAKPVFTWEPGVMWREGRNYAITVQGDIVEGLQGATVTQELLPKLKELERASGRPAIASRWRARWRRAARALRRSRPACRSCCSSPSRC
jgi:multidrug efflux pump